MASSIRVAFLEDDPAMRASLVQILSSHSRIELLGGCGTLAELVQTLETRSADVVLMDLQLGSTMDGIGATALVRSRFPDTMVLILTLFDQTHVVFEALRAGAIGYLLKGADPESILAAIEEVAEGGAPMTGSIARRVIQRFHQVGDSAASGDPAADPGDILSLREAEVLGALASGCRYKEVAVRLGVSHNTIRSHVRRIFEKLHAHGVQEAARKARSAGIRLER